MPPADYTETSLGSLPPEFWFWAVLIPLMTAALGFFLGLAYSRYSARLALQRARSGLQQLFQSVIDSLDNAQQVCSWLEEFQGGALSQHQAETLAAKRNGLLETISRVVERCLSSQTPAPSADENPPAIDPAQVPWERTPVDSRTGLPDRSAFQTNAELLFELRVEGGLLLIKVDKFEQLKSRYTERAASELLKKMAGVICRAIRDSDIVCQYSHDTFAALLPGASNSAGRKLAETIRDSVRHYHFRLEAGGREVLMTASFGFSAVGMQDNVDLIINRAADALARSERIGRNQLHFHNGQALVHCRAR